MDTKPTISTLTDLKLRLKSRMEKKSSVKTVGHKISELREKTLVAPGREDNQSSI